MKKILFASITLPIALSIFVSCEELSLDTKTNDTPNTTTKASDTIVTTKSEKTTEPVVILKASVQDLRDYYYSIPQLTYFDEIISQAKNYNLNSFVSYRSETGDGEDAWDAHIYIAPQSYSNNYGDFYEFSCDYIDIFVERRDRSQPFQLSKAHYNFYGSLYNVEYWAKGNLAGNHIFVCKGLYAVDPTATFNSLEEALEQAISLS
ncbi:MAG: hypothetical protein J6X56_07320 [Ruminococcus sp.]|nr:hypothetical protein [Ruminococcus sp.]